MGELCGIPLVLSHPRFLVVQKPAGLLSQPGLGPHQQDSLITRLQRGCQQLRLVHRLDRDTSGLVVVARDQDSLRDMSALFAARRVQKLYWPMWWARLASSGVARINPWPGWSGIHPAMARIPMANPAARSGGGKPGCLEPPACGCVRSPAVPIS